MGAQLLGSVPGSSSTLTGTVLVPSTKSLNVANGPTQLVAANAARIAVKFVVFDPTQMLFLGIDNTLTTANGFPVFSRIPSDWIYTTAAVFGVVDGGAAVDIRILEVRSA